ncbi:tRNA threonylcarbamoyladenosine dehydratase [Pseudobdellovibrio exovorus]|uniref:THIF family protein n=1 Tax=Pseudobdellovibrio exovorus JSS TaxID=1184267 RepID=M4VB31_9BACT|nr:tRNA threonylcarbamoyladenosine dehydratase [Pseudobdellovibrio exovorus]AGH95231.1 THIF family protein [Pseudobdellovibrio exovorus JSS]
MQTPNSETKAAEATIQNVVNHSPVNNITETKYVLHRRFDRMGRLVGDEMMQKLFNTHVMVIGLGGVGSWAAESLARSGVGRLTIIDFDEICITNANRQLHALQGFVGHKKSNVMAERLRKINPQARIESLPLFYNKDTAEEILTLQPDYILDAIDNLTAKTHLLNECRQRGIKVITSGGASGKMDPTRISIVDLAKTHIDPLSHSVRKILRQEYAFPRGKNELFDIPCVFSDEIPAQPIELKYDNGQGFKCVCPQGEIDPHGCLHRSVIYGTASFVTGAFGLAMASWVVRQITTQQAVVAPEVL